MARTAALGDGPVSFFRKGVLIEVPLSALYFENDVVGTTRADLALQPEFLAWIRFLKSRGRLVADVAPQSAKALTVKAVDTGSLGNSIQFTVAPKSAPGVTPVTVDVTVTETDQYEGVTLATLGTLLGIKGGTAGTKPGLLWLTANPTAATSALVPVESPPPAGVTVTAGAAGALPTWVIVTAPGAGGAAGATVFTLEPRRPGTGATLFDATNLKLVSITNVRPAAAGATSPTFTLTVTWSKTIPDVTLSPATFAATLAPLGYLVTFAGPDGTAAITKVPQTGTVVLTGGSDTVAPVRATATVMATD